MSCTLTEKHASFYHAVRSGLSALSMPRPGYDAVLLLTGFPSFHARKMLEQILATEPRALVYAVVPQKVQAQAQAIVDGLLPEQRARVAMLEGEATAIDL